jgi:hypothetical protein
MNAMKWIVLLLTVLNLSCSKDTKDNPFSNQQQSFGPQKQDKIVRFNKENSKKINWEFSGWISTDEFMQSLVSLFEYAPNSEIPYHLLDKYYSNPHTTTKVSIDNGTYVEAALGIYGPDIFNSINVGNSDNYKYLANAFSNWKTEITADLSPEQIIGQFIAMLKGLPQHLVNYEVSSSVASKVSGSLDPYLKALTKTQGTFSRLEQVKRKGVLASNLEKVEQALWDLKNATLIQQDEYSKLQETLAFPKQIDFLINDTSPQGFLIVLMEILLFKRNEYLLQVGKKDIGDLTSAERKELLASFPVAMHEFADTFIDDDEDEIRWYQRGEYDNVWSPAQTFYLDWALEDLMEQDIPALALEVEYEISNLVIKKLAAQLKAKATELPKTVSEIAMELFSEAEKGFYKDFYAKIKGLAANEIKNKLLGGEESFPGVEGKYLFWPVDETKNTFQSFFVTGGKEIGAAIQANIYFFENVDKAPKELVDKKFKTYVFALLNRLLAIYGYRDFQGMLYKSLHQKFSPTESVGLDIYSYDVEPGVFAIPDNLILDGSYKVSPQIPQNLVQTVSGKAAMLKATAKMLDFFADYNKNAFDRDFATFQFENFSVFPKEPIFDLSLGSVSIILRNLMKGEVVFFDKKGERIVGTNDVFADAKGAGSVAILSRKGETLQENIQGTDTAEFIISLASLLHSARSLPMAKAGLLSRLVDGRQQDLQAIMDLQPALRKLQYGLGLFLHNKLMQDGWLANTYSLDNNSLSAVEYNLVRQLKFIQAMLAVYNEWKSELFLWAAIDGYYALNHRLLNVDGGYKMHETAFPLYEVTETWKTLTILQTSIRELSADKKTWWSEDSEKQLSQLVDFYRSNWQELANVQ